MPSYSPVYSSQFIVYTPAAPNTEFLVPAGFTAVVREIDYYQEAGSSTMVVSIQDSDDAPVATFAALNLTGTINSDQWTGRVPVPAGGTIELYGVSIGTGFTAVVSGYLLRNNLT